jgi:hypothetical protein
VKFQIKKVVIWPRSKNFPPREVDFKTNCVNVITGASRTGKSAIIPIIDYCLASSDCSIPIDTIRDNASWYGIVVETPGEDFLIARKVPEGTKVSNDFYYLGGRNLSIPNEILVANEKQDGIKQMLNAISSVPYFSLGGESDIVGYQARLGFRDLMGLVFQSQEIVANQNIIFYKTHAHEHRERLRNWFPYILGAENIETLNARQQLVLVERKLKQLQKEADSVKKISSSWMNNMLRHLNTAQKYGLVEDEISDDLSAEDLLIIAKKVININPNYSNTSMGDLESSNKKIGELENQIGLLGSEVGVTNKRLIDITSLKKGMHSYGHSVKKRAQRLHLSQWLEDISQQSLGCPACGDKSHPKATNELLKISNAFKVYEHEAKKVSDIPTSFTREEERLKRELTAMLDLKSNLEKQLNSLIASDVKVQEEFQNKKNLFIFLGHFKASVDTFESLSAGGDFQSELEKLLAEYNRLKKITDPRGVRTRVESAVGKVSQLTLKYLEGLDVDDKYRQVAPRFSEKDLNISIRSDDGNWHYLAEVGSASNWVSFHIALMCALQEFFSNLDDSVVPSFVVFDQPSQVYFPKVKRGAEVSDHDFDDEDLEAVKMIFKTLSKACSENSWQSIVLDHADEAVYGEVDNIHEVDIWRDGVKLIPEEWYKK